MPLPKLWLLSDARNDHLLDYALDRLPEYSGFVFRHHHLDGGRRRARYEPLASQCRVRKHLVILAGDCATAREWGADGAYGRADMLDACEGVLRFATVHNAAEIERADRVGVDAMFLSPVFATRSHPGAEVLGAERFHALAARARAPIIALGGLTAERATALGWPRWGAIDGLS